ncbi:MAG: acetylornithine transaminase [Betaproteobacteria bacterium]|nr:acetylornithine transaminase [Betaproteobacteria bacterium]
MNNYGRLPVAFSHGDGVWLWDTDGKQYLDAITGIAVTGVGHAHPRLVRAISEQAGRLIHASNLYRIPEQERLADRLAAISGMDRVFFCNSGCEANEAAIKIARLHGHQKGIDQPVIVVMEKSFHGRTMATLSATGNRKVQAGFEPLLAGFARVPYDDRATIAHVAETNKNVVAVLVEPVQGEGGVNVPDDGYLAFLRELCDAHGWLLMLDEVQSGMGRTGKWFAHQWCGIEADVMTLAKGLGNGFPIGACLARGSAAEAFTPGKHGSTFGGNPLACVAAQTTLDIIDEEGLIENASRMGQLIRDGLADSLRGLGAVREIRGKGLMIGIELDRPCGEIVRNGLDAGILVNVTADTVVRMLPPLVIRQPEATRLVEQVSELIHAFVRTNEPVPAAG